MSASDPTLPESPGPGSTPAPAGVPADRPTEPERVSDRQRAGWGPAGEPTYDRRTEERRRADVAQAASEADQAAADRREDLRRADDRWDSRRAPGPRSDGGGSYDADPAPLRIPALGSGSPTVETAFGAGRLLAVVLVIVIAFAGGVAVDQAAWRGTVPAAGATVGTPAPLSTGAIQPPSTTAPVASGAPVTSSAPGSGAPSATGAPSTGSPGPQVTPGPTIGPGATVPPNAPANISILWDVLQLVQQHFVRRADLNPTDLTYGAINGLIDSLGDPGHTTFLTPDEVKSENDALSGTITGIGVFLGVQGGAPFVQSVVSGSPAARAGVLPGDLIIAVNGTNAENLSLEDIAKLVRGPVGTQVTVTVIHAHSNAPVDITITRETITIPAVSWVMLPGTSFADIRIAEFSDGTTDQFVTALRAAREAGAKGIVLDLRNNPGGFVDDAVGVASQFLGTGNVYIRKTADGQRIPVPVASGGIATSIPLVVLVDYGSASSAEITAGALQDAKRGPLIGTRTYGTGTVLNTYNLPDGSAVRLGVEEWLTPSGRAIFPNGIQPDQEVDLTTDIAPLEPDTIRTMTSDALQASGDTQMLRAIQDLSGS